MTGVDKGDKKRGAVNGQKDAGCREEHPVVCSLDEVSFRYERNTGDVLRQVSLDIYENEILMINGSNGCGKSTMLSLIANVYRPYSGKLRIAKGLRTGMLPQNPELLFTRRSVRDELIDAKDRQQLADIVRFCRLEDLLDRHPYDLSGGEKQRLGLAKVLIADPDILLMDEPTKGLDNEFKMQLSGMLRKLQSRGKTIVVVSHDIEFCAVAGDRAALLFDGEVATVSDVRSYMSDNNFFTTAASRISRNVLDCAVTVQDVLAAYGADLDVTGAAGSGSDDHGGESDTGKTDNLESVKKSETGISDDKLADIILSKDRKVENLSIWQIVTIAVTTVIIIFGFWNTMSVSDLSGLVQQMTVTAEGWKYLVLYGVMIVAIFGLLVAIRPITKKKNEEIVMDSAGRGFGKRTVVSIVAVLVLIPATIWFGVARLGDKKYFFISLLVLLEAMLPFFVSFEDRKPKVRDIVTLAVMCALAVTGVLHVAELHACHGDRYHRRGGIWMRGWIYHRCNDHVRVKFHHGTGTVDSVADVCHGTCRIPCRAVLCGQQRENKKYDKAWTVYIWCTYMYSGVRRNHESGICRHVAAKCEFQHDHGVLCDGISI